jgi:phosphoglucosamine mutase
VLLNFDVARKTELGQLPDVMRTIRGVEQKLGKDGRVLVRYSGTESKVRVMVEGPDARRNDAWAREIGQVLVRALKA